VGRLETIVGQFDPLLKSLIGGQNIHRAAIWGQAAQESNFDPAAEEIKGSDHGGKGLLQWTGPRFTNGLRPFAQQLGKPWQDAEAQVRFIAHELAPGGAENHSWAQTQKTSTVEAATETFMLDYERPALQGGPPTYGTARLDRRITGAKASLAVIQAANTGDGKVTDTSAIAPAAATRDNVLADWIKKNEVSAETVIRQLLVAKGVPGFAVDLVFSILNPLIEQMTSNVHPNDIANLIAEHVINPLLSNLTKKAG
jgi:hypothetical protein